jgi:hypothetical protein
MDALMTVRGMCDRYGCSMPTARKYLRQCDPHMENPLAAPMWAVQEWEDSRIAVPVQTSRKTRAEHHAGIVHVPRHR